MRMYNYYHLWLYLFYSVEPVFDIHPCYSVGDAARAAGPRCAGIRGGASRER